jgi:Fe-S-cluster-containing dehydrogenase component
MKLDRRRFLETLGAAAATGIAGRAEASAGAPADDAFGVLTDLSLCIGCRKCEWACNQANDLPVQPLVTFEDKSVFRESRRPDAGHYTVVNEYIDRHRSKPVWVKVQCMHCLEPACASACIVSALERQPNGAVAYDAWRCIGCRYCMVACPFQIPAYEYRDALTPEVRKCTLCFQRISKEGGVPACVEICPPQCLTFGRRSRLLELARHKIRQAPEKYVDHIYGEHEVGGTSWLYVSPVPMEEVGLPDVPHRAPPRLTETIQHGVFKYFIPPVALYVVLGGIMKLYDRTDDEEAEDAAS